ncbi:MAG: CBS domain-containing protein [Candidatus Altiarchaeota archaeon]|nr:CBS domain-containing protein [Candidatus Altiarchaeota archaeon]
MLVKDVMSQNVIFVSSEESVFEAVKLMALHNISGLVVGSRGRVEGVITMKDIFRKLVVLEKDIRKSKVGEYMSSPAVTVNQLNMVEKVAEVMGAKKIKRLVVVDSTGNAVGVITAMDVVSKVPKLLHVMFDTWVKPGWR